MTETGRNLGWLDVRVPLWALFMAVFGTGAASLQGAGGLLFQDMQPQFQVIEERLSAFQRELDGHAAALGKKVDKETRDEMLLTLAKEREAMERNFIQLWQAHGRELDAAKMEMTRRLDALERHMEATDERLQRLSDGLYGRTK